MSASPHLTLCLPRAVGGQRIQEANRKDSGVTGSGAKNISVNGDLEKPLTVAHSLAISKGDSTPERDSGVYYCGS